MNQSGWGRDHLGIPVGEAGIRGFNTWAKNSQLSSDILGYDQVHV